MSKTTDIMRLVESQRQQLAVALPTGVKPDRVVRLVRTVLATSDLLQQCSPRSILGAAIECAQLGLEPGITAHLVPMWDGKSKSYRATLIADYRGLMALARRSGDVGAIYAEVVRAGDEFDFARGTEPVLVHKPRLGNQGDVIAAYAVARYSKDQSTQFEVVDAAELHKVRDAALSKIRNERAREYSPWMTSFEAMAKKTAVRRLCKFLPSSVEDVELQRAIVLDEAGDRGEQNLGATLDGEWETADETPPERPTAEQVEALGDAIEEAKARDRVAG